MIHVGIAYFGNTGLLKKPKLYYYISLIISNINTIPPSFWLLASRKRWFLKISNFLWNVHKSKCEIRHLQYSSSDLVSFNQCSLFLFNNKHLLLLLISSNSFFNSCKSQYHPDPHPTIITYSLFICFLVGQDFQKTKSSLSLQCTVKAH